MIAVSLGVLAALAQAPQVPEAPSPIELRWQAPAECPDRAAVQDRLRVLLRGQVVAGAGLRADAIVTSAQGGGWRLELTIEGAALREQRTIATSDCAALAEVTALLLAIALAPEYMTAQVYADDGVAEEPLAGGARADDGPSIAAAPSAGAPARAEAPEPAGEALAPPRAAPRRAALQGAVRIVGGGEVGGIPAWTPATGLVAALLGRRWRVELGGTYGARRLTYAEPEGVGGRFTWWGAAVRGCGVARWRRFELPVCGGVELGLLRGEGRGVTSRQSAEGVWVALQVAPSAAWVPRRWLALSIGAEILIALRQPAFHIQGLPVLARAYPVGVRPLLGVELRFP